MFASQLIIAGILLFIAAWLHWNEQRGWVDEQFDNETDQVYLSRRTRSRKYVQIMFGICGLLILISAFAGPGRIFVAVWTTVSFVLMVVLVFAFFDVLRTHNYEKHKRRELRDLHESTLKQ